MNAYLRAGSSSPDEASTDGPSRGTTRAPATTLPGVTARSVRLDELSAGRRVVRGAPVDPHVLQVIVEVRELDRARHLTGVAIRNTYAL